MQAIHQAAKVTELWEPVPGVVTPGERIGNPPADAVMLFDGESLNAWSHLDGSDATWIIEDQAVTVKPGSGNIRTKGVFTDVQLHIEWRTPKTIESESQGRGNSGVFLMGEYEVQVLDSHNNPTYPNGQAASIYKQHIPLVNASRGPGEWQSYDIIFRAPQFADDGRLRHPATITVLHNGVLVQNHVTLAGPTSYVGAPNYEAHGPAPLVLQDHSNRVSFRNIWIRNL
ncbi:MAG: DUF1080 domain-containing protein [Pseudomonadota bacterium]